MWRCSIIRPASQLFILIRQFYGDLVCVNRWVRLVFSHFQVDYDFAFICVWNEPVAHISAKDSPSISTQLGERHTRITINVYCYVLIIDLPLRLIYYPFLSFLYSIFLIIYLSFIIIYILGLLPHAQSQINEINRINKIDKTYSTDNQIKRTKPA